ncbi:MAG: cbb3-type cytochrome oxidase assembly protein [Deltaproteobacteria bacterium]|nr:cbb3-type cytochrome oxidase assembly protein [Deltaproteobacteria bacterium]
MNYSLAWILLVMASLWIALAAFVWGVRSGQFSDQERARYLPLRDGLPPAPAADPKKRPAELYVLLAIGGLGLLGLLSPLILTLLHGRG